MEKNCIINKRMVLSLLIAIGIMGHTYITSDIHWKESDVLHLLTFPMAMSMFNPFAAIFPAFPHAMSFTEDYNTSFFRFVLIRCTRGKYILRKIFSVGLSGGIMMILSYGFIFLIAFLIGVPTTTENISEFYLNTLWYPIAAIWGGGLVLLLKLTLAFLFGLVWSNICLFLSVLFLNRYVAFIGTFIMYQFLWQALSANIWNPVYLLRGDWGYASYWQPVLIQTFIFSIVCVLNWIGLKGRLKNG